MSPVTLKVINPSQTQGNTLYTNGGDSLNLSRTSNTDPDLQSFKASFISLDHTKDSFDKYLADEQKNTQKGTYFSFGQDNALDLHHVVEASFRHLNGSNLDFKSTNMIATVRVKTACTNKNLQNLKVFYLREHDDEPKWKENKANKTKKRPFLSQKPTYGSTGQDGRKKSIEKTDTLWSSLISLLWERCLWTVLLGLVSFSVAFINPQMVKLLVAHVQEHYEATSRSDYKTSHEWKG